MKKATILLLVIFWFDVSAEDDVPEALGGFLNPVTFADIETGFSYGQFGWYTDENGVYTNAYPRCAKDVYHPGRDINMDCGGGNCELGWPIFPVAKGKVVSVSSEHDVWNQVIIKHNYLGNAEEIFYSVYGHSEFQPSECKKIADEKGFGFDMSFLERGRPEVGEIVDPHEQLGCVWDHGAPEFAHLHLEIRKGRTHPDPESLTYFCGVVPGTNSTEYANESVTFVERNYEAPYPFIQKSGPYEHVTGTETFVWSPGNSECHDADRWYRRSINAEGNVSLSLLYDRTKSSVDAFALCDSNGIAPECRFD